MREWPSFAPGPADVGGEPAFQARDPSSSSGMPSVTHPGRLAFGIAASTAAALTAVAPTVVRGGSHGVHRVLRAPLWACRGGAGLPRGATLSLPFGAAAPRALLEPPCAARPAFAVVVRADHLAALPVENHHLRATAPAPPARLVERVGRGGRRRRRARAAWRTISILGGITMPAADHRRCSRMRPNSRRGRGPRYRVLLGTCAPRVGDRAVLIPAQQRHNGFGRRVVSRHWRALQDTESCAPRVCGRRLVVGHQWAAEICR
jgi:hypothetical protein